MREYANISIYIKPQLLILLVFMYYKEPNADIKLQQTR